MAIDQMTFLTITELHNTIWQPWCSSKFPPALQRCQYVNVHPCAKSPNDSVRVLLTLSDVIDKTLTALPRAGGFHINSILSSSYS